MIALSQDNYDPFQTQICLTAKAASKFEATWRENG